MRHTTEDPGTVSPVDEARVAIWRLFEEGYVDEDMATASLLAIGLGTRRAPRDTHPRRGPAERTPATRHERHAA